MAALWQVPLSVNQNEDAVFVTVWANAASGLQSQLSDATPFSFAGAAGYFKVLTAVGGTLIYDLTSANYTAPTFGGPVNIPDGINNVSCGTITLTFTNAATLLMSQGVWYYDLLICIGTNNTYYMSGTFTVLGTAARI